MKLRILLLATASVLPLATATTICESACSTLLSSYSFSGCLTSESSSSASSICCTSTAYAESYTLCLANCNVRERVATWNSFRRQCAYALCDTNGSYDEIYSNALDNSETAAAAANSTSLSVAVEVLPASFESQYAYQRALAANSLHNKIYGTVLVLFWFLAVFIAALARLHGILFDRLKRPRSPTSRWIQKNLALPPLFGRQHMESVKIAAFPVGQLPLLWQSCVIGLFCFLNLIFVVAEFDADLEAKEIMSENSQMILFSAKRTGVMAIFLLIPTLQFAGRNAFLCQITGWSSDTFRLFHRWCARVAAFDVFVHGVLETVYFVSMKIYTTVVIDAISNLVGVIATIILALIIIESFHAFQRLWYEIVMTIHIVLAVAFVLLLKYHIDSTVYVYLVYTAAAVYLFDRLLRLLRVVYGNFSGQAEIHANQNATQVTVKPFVPFTYKPGQFAYMYTLRLNFWLANPFSVAQSDELGYFFVAKRFNRVTRRIHAHAVDKQTSRARIWIEGPYGVSYPLEKYDNVLLLAGGVGVTAAMSYALSLQRKGSNRKVSFYWVIRDRENVGWMTSQLRQISECPFMDVHIYITSEIFKEPPASAVSRSKSLNEKSYGARLYETVEIGEDFGMTEKLVSSFSTLNVTYHTGRPNVPRVVEREIREEAGSLAVFTCGPAGFVDLARTTVIRNLDVRPDRRIDYFEDGFS
ncbi:ferric reductase NAD binding domain-containing protein [Myxozyma melibiosi]|uniref:ferric-chelate reductase (NADPH) n=1 Tax=Myxozyma melibiosi TaxID=54550 RepID=A0ABR1F8T5_9ASCO